MISASLTWDRMKAKGLSLRYADTDGNYYIFASDARGEYDCVFDKTSSDAEDFEENYKGTATEIA